MLDGIDWVNDREWTKMVFLHSDVQQANRILAYNYPHFRKPRVVQVASSDD